MNEAEVLLKKIMESERLLKEEDIERKANRLLGKLVTVELNDFSERGIIKFVSPLNVFLHNKRRIVIPIKLIQSIKEEF